MAELTLASLAERVASLERWREALEGVPQPLAALSTYVDPSQWPTWGQSGQTLQPERAYSDTWPAQRFLDAVGINFNVTDAQVTATAKLLGQAGFRRARIECGFGNCDPANPATLLRSQREALQRRIAAFRDNGIRPLVVLNANPGAPCPHRAVNLALTAPAAAGDATVELDPASIALVAPGRTGFPSGGVMARHLITALADDGTATLSRPLVNALPAGKTPNGLVYTLSFEPFGAEGSDRYARTLAGWLAYVSAVAAAVKETLGSEDFDFEVWNEAIGNGAAFLNINSYYEPALESGAGGHDGLLRETIELLARDFPAVKVGNGFANTSQHGVSVLGSAVCKHPYRSRVNFTAPAYSAFFPEFHLTGIEAFPVLYDLAPFDTSPNPQKSIEWHGRDQGPCWITEYGLASNDPTVKAKTALRALIAYIGKGAEAVHLFAAAYGGYALIDPAFFTGGSPGLAIEAVGRLTAALQPEPITTPRTLTLESVATFGEGEQFSGLRDLDVVAFHPFQTGPDSFTAALYVESRDLAKPPTPTVYRLELDADASAQVELYDPLTDEALSATKRPGSTLTVDVELTDSPRLLRIG